MSLLNLRRRNHASLARCGHFWSRRFTYLILSKLSMSIRFISDPCPVRRGELLEYVTQLRWQLDTPWRSFYLRVQYLSMHMTCQFMVTVFEFSPAKEFWVGDVIAISLT